MLRHLLDHQYRIEIAEALAAKRLGNRHAEKAGDAQALDLVPRIGLAAVDLGGARRHLGFSESAGARLQVLLGRGELEFHRRHRTLSACPGKACPGLDPGWEPVFREGYEQCKESGAPILANTREFRHLL
jgi:hypothetical protein